MFASSCRCSRLAEGEFLCDLPQVQSSKYELLWIKVGLCVNENGSFAKRGAILERAAKWARGL